MRLLNAIKCKIIRLLLETVLPKTEGQFFLYKKREYSQTVPMEKIKVYETEIRTREERETCFPCGVKNIKRGGQVRDDG